MAKKLGDSGWQVYFWEQDYHALGEKGINFSRRYIMAKRRWAGVALDRAKVSKEDQKRWTRFDVPGTNVVIFAPPVTEAGLLCLDPGFVRSQREYHRELNAILDVPIEEADGIRTIASRTKPGRA